MRGPGAMQRLERALAASAARAGVTITIDDRAATAWCSATFSGARHILRGSAPRGPALSRWLGALPETDLPLHGHVVADIVVAGVSRAAGRVDFRLEALTVESG